MPASAHVFGVLCARPDASQWLGLHPPASAPAGAWHMQDASMGGACPRSRETHWRCQPTPCLPIHRPGEGASQA